MLIELNWFWTACVPFSIFEMAPQIEKRDWFSLRSLFGSPAGRIRLYLVGGCPRHELKKSHLQYQMIQRHT